MPFIGGSAQAAENQFEIVTAIWAPTVTERTTVGPTVYPIFAVKAGDRVIALDARVREAFDGTQDFTVGDGDDADGYLDAGDTNPAVAALYEGNAANQAKGGKLYLADDNVDMTFTGDAAGTTGILLIRALILRGRGTI
jgi:hypothetical protein